MKTALITGASSGIGLELANIFASDNINLVLVARNIEALRMLEEKIKQKNNISVTIIQKDLSVPGSATEVFEKTKNENIKINYLINNAGFGDLGYFHESDWKKQEQMINLNIIALAHLTRLFVTEMIKHGSGKIMNVASVAAFVAGPLMSIYYATKAFVLSFSEALASELKGTGVTVTALCPGPTLSGFQKAASAEHVNLFKYRKIPTSKEVAKYGYRAMMKGKTTAIHGFMNKLLSFSIRFSPRSLARGIAMKLNSSKK